MVLGGQQDPTGNRRLTQNLDQQQCGFFPLGPWGEGCPGFTHQNSPGSQPSGLENVQAWGLLGSAASPGQARPGCGRGGSPVTVYGTHGCEDLSDNSRLMLMPLTSCWSLTSFLASETQLPHQKNGDGCSLTERVIGKLETLSLMLGTLVGLQCCCCLVVHLCPTLCDSMDCSPPGSSVHGISKARVLEWVVISFSKEFS